LLHYAFKYGGDFEGALLANANGGGECVARGMLIGALLGAAHGASNIPEKLKQGLVARVGIAREIKQFLTAIQRTPSQIDRQDDQLLPSQTSSSKKQTGTQAKTAGRSKPTDEKLSSFVENTEALSAVLKPEGKCIAQATEAALPCESNCGPVQPPASVLPVLMMSQYPMTK